MNCADVRGAGPTVPLTAAPTVHPPRPRPRASARGCYSINGGKMNGFNCVVAGRGHDRLHAVRPRLAAGVLGATPTASCWPTTSSRRCTGRRSPSTCTRSPRSPTASSTTRRPPSTEGNYCDDPPEYTQRFPIEDLTDADIKRDHGAGGEHHRRDPGSAVRRSRRTGSSTRTCINIPVLPDELEEAGDQLEVLRQRRRVDERAAGDPARAVRSACGRRCSRPRRS